MVPGATMPCEKWEVLPDNPCGWHPLLWQQGLLEWRFPGQVQTEVQGEFFPAWGDWQRDQLLEEEDQTSTEKVVQLFEKNFGAVRSQMIPCDGGINTEDLSSELPPREAFAYRSVVGTCLYLARDRPDLLYTVKELSGAMSRPTYTALQRLKKLVGYLKATPDFCVLLDYPVGGQGKWRATDRFWILETDSDSDWSGHQTHRRSTSCGIHMLNGSFLFGSSRTQRVVSLSSCESELHSMVSALSDGIFLNRCLMFICGGEVQHVLFTDSSSGRQLAMRQGTGKVKHLSGKILWIQDAVRTGLVELSQISAVWNLSDIGTKALGIQRVRLLLHELNVATGRDLQIVGQVEYQTQCSKHGGKHDLSDLSKLVREVTHVLMVLGLESMTLTGVAWMAMLDDDDVPEGQRNKEPNDATSTTAGWSYGFWFFIMPILFALGFFLWKVWKRAKDAYDSYEQNYTDLAVLESAFERFQRENQFLRCDINALQVEELLGQMRRLREGHNELQGEIVQDSSELVHYGLVQLGGFTFFQTLDPGHRRHMYELERGSMVAHRTMGADRYLAVVRQQNQGTARGGDDTDMLQDNSSEEALREIRAQVHEQLESDEEEGDDVGLAPSENNFNIATETLRSEVNQSLQQHHYARAAQLQQMVMMILDTTHVDRLISSADRVLLFNGLGDRMESLADENRLNDPVTAQRYGAYAGQFREMANEGWEISRTLHETMWTEYKSSCRCGESLRKWVWAIQLKLADSRRSPKNW